MLTGWVVFRANGFSTAGSILSSLLGTSGFSGRLSERGLPVIAALASVLIPSVHEMKDRDLRPYPAYAFGGRPARTASRAHGTA